MSVGIVDKQTGDRIPTAGIPAIDNALSAISTNPVQNAIITAALANKQDKTDNSLQTTDKTIVGAINENAGDIGSLKSGLTNLTKYANLASGAAVNIIGSACILFAFREDSIISNTVNAVGFCTNGGILYFVNSGGNTSPLSATYSNGVTTVTNTNRVAVNFGYVVLTN